MNFSPSSKNSLWAVSGLLTIAVLVGGTYLFQSRRATLTAMSDPHQRDTPGNKPPEFKAQKEQEEFEQVKKMREGWRVAWASNHKDVLLAMLHSRPGDDSAWMNVIAQMPIRVSEKNIGFDLFSGSPHDAGNPDKLFTSWNAHWPLRASPDSPELVEEAKRLTETKRDFICSVMVEWHDVKISEVGNIAADRLCCLWASGRVTWRTIYSKRVGVGAQAHSVSIPEQQVLPPYEFLTEDHPR